MCCCGGSDDEHRHRRRHQSESSDGCFDCCLCAPCRSSTDPTSSQSSTSATSCPFRWVFNFLSCIFCCGCCCCKKEEEGHHHHRVGRPSYSSNKLVRPLVDSFRLCIKGCHELNREGEVVIHRKTYSNFRYKSEDNVPCANYPTMILDLRDDSVSLSLS